MSFSILVLAPLARCACWGKEEEEEEEEGERRRGKGGEIGVRTRAIH